MRSSQANIIAYVNFCTEHMNSFNTQNVWIIRSTKYNSTMNLLIKGYASTQFEFVVRWRYFLDVRDD